MWGVAILTMVVGSLLALTQTDVKRMLAYSSSRTPASSSSASSRINRGRPVRLAVLPAGLRLHHDRRLRASSRSSATPDGEATHLSQWAGLGERSPLVAGVFALFLLAFAGIPLTSGFTGKFAVFSRRHRRRRDAAGRRRCGRERDRRVLLRPRHRADVLLRAGRPTARASSCPARCTTAGHRDRRRGHRGPRRRPAAGARPGRPRRRSSFADARPVEPVSERLPSGCRRRRRRSTATIRAGLDAVEAAAARRGEERLPVRHRGGPAPGRRRAASGSGRCSCCSPRSSATRRRPASYRRRSSSS